MLLALSGCSVYVPMQGAAPDIRAKGELEVSGGWSLTNRLDFGATYSPLPHLLVRAAASFKGSAPAHPDSANYLQNKQYELAAGTYWPLGERWLVGGLAGFGRAHARARYQEDGFALLSSAVQHQFDAHYNRYFSETYLTCKVGALATLGLSYRLVQLRLTEATDQSVAVQASPIWRHEPMVFFRVRPSEDSPVQFQAAVGASRSAHYDEQTAGDRYDPARQFRTTRSYVSVGVALYPHLLRQRR
ncbi:hypothetical protein [Hymenobacter bucti]|uniref:hypothetical protein n=1 Tax=Hymenobacter bucti TaxID=1844114 RepID=UPI0036D3B100